LDVSLTALHKLRKHAFRDMPRAFVRNVAWQYLSVVTVTTCGFLYTIVVGRALGVANYGLMSLGLGFASLLFGLVQVRLHEAVIRFVTEHIEHGEPKKAVATVYLSLIVDAITCVCAFGAILILAPAAQSHLLRDPRGVTVLALSAGTLLATNIGSATAVGVLRACDQFKWHSVVSAAGAAAKVIATMVALSVFGGGVITVLTIAALAAFATNAAVLGGAAFWLIRRVGPQNLRASVGLVRPQLRTMSVFAGNTYLLSLSGSVLRDLDVNALGWFTSLEVVGMYRVAKSFAALLSQVSDPVLFALLPELSRFWVREEYVRLKAFVLRITVLGAAAGVLMYAASALVVPWLIVHVLGRQFQGAGVLFQGMVWWVLVGMPFMWAHSLACAAGRPGLSLRASFASNGLALVLYLVLIPRFGGMGASLAYGTGLAAASVIAAAISWRACVVPMFAPTASALPVDVR
jgi:O-antigen/teichoic acid export membrane protein